MADLEITNDPFLEQQGIIASVEYAERHFQNLSACWRARIQAAPLYVEAVSAICSDKTDCEGSDERIQQLLQSLSTAAAVPLTEGGFDTRCYLALRASFPSLDVRRVDDDSLKSNDGAKEQWTKFLQTQDGVIDDFNMISLLRVSPHAGVYDDENTILVPRAQYVLTESARNFELLNDWPTSVRAAGCSLPHFYHAWFEAAYASPSTAQLISDRIALIGDVIRCSLESRECSGMAALLQELSLHPFLSPDILKRTRIAVLLRKQFAASSSPSDLHQRCARHIAERWRLLLPVFRELSRCKSATPLPPPAPSCAVSSDHAIMDIGALDFSRLESLIRVQSNYIRELEAAIVRPVALTVHGDEKRDVVLVYCRLRPSARLYSAKCQLLESLGLGSIREFALSSEQPLPSELLNYMRICLLSYSEWKGAAAVRLSAASLFLSERHERRVLQTLVMLLEALSGTSNAAGEPERVVITQAILLLRHRLSALHAMPSLSAGEASGVVLSLDKDDTVLDEVEQVLAPWIGEMEQKALQGVEVIVRGAKHEYDEETANEVWRECHRLALQALLDRATNEIGVRRQHQNSSSPSVYRNERCHALITPEAAAEFSETGLLVLDGVLCNEKLKSIEEEITEMYHRNELKSTFQACSDVRLDRITWLDEGDLCSEGSVQCKELATAISLLKGFAIELQEQCGATVVVPRQCMLSVYEHGAYYKSHRDNVCKSGDSAKDQCVNTREATLLLYLNTSWRAGDGGCLRCMFTSSDEGCAEDCGGTRCHRDIEPVGGRMVVFRSKELLHEVLPSYSRRFALSCWLLSAEAL